MGTTTKLRDDTRAEYAPTIRTVMCIFFSDYRDGLSGLMQLWAYLIKVEPLD